MNGDGPSAIGGVPLHALLVEDSDDDALLIEQLAESSKVDVQMDRVNNGEAAIAYLQMRATNDHGSGIPHFVLLDLSLPRVGGIEILRRIKSDPRLQDIPVIILSGTENEEEIRIGQDLRAHTHIVKPISATEFVWIVQSIQNYWPRIERLRGLTQVAG